jgi:hypothetical protein
LQGNPIYEYVSSCKVISVWHLMALKLTYVIISRK